MDKTEPFIFRPSSIPSIHCPIASQYFGIPFCGIDLPIDFGLRIQRKVAVRSVPIIQPIEIPVRERRKPPNPLMITNEIDFINLLLTDI